MKKIELENIENPSGYNRDYIRDSLLGPVAGNIDYCSIIIGDKKHSKTTGLKMGGKQNQFLNNAF